MVRTITASLYNDRTGKDTRVDIKFNYFPGSMGNLHEPAAGEEVIIRDIVEHGSIVKSVYEDYSDAEAEAAVHKYLNEPY